MAAQLKAYRQADRDRLIRTERTTQLAIDSLPDAVIVVNPAGRIDWPMKRPSACSISLPARAWRKCKYHGLPNCTSRSPHGTRASQRIRIDRPDRRRRRHPLFLPRTIPITTENQQPIGTTVVLADVTGLRRLDEMKNGLLALVSHELKTPLTGMRMVLHLVTEERVGALTPKQKELLDSARDDAERLHAIVDSLLDMARIESGRALMELQPVAPAALAAHAADSLRGAFETQQVALSITATKVCRWRAPTRRASATSSSTCFTTHCVTPGRRARSHLGRPADDWSRWA